MASREADGIAGAVFSPNGEPAEGANVTVFSKDSGGRDPSKDRARLYMTNREGRYCIPEPLYDLYRVSIHHKSGFAMLPAADFKKASRIKLQPWGRVTGQCLVGDLPVAGASVVIQCRFFETQTAGPKNPCIIQHNAVTGDDGRFSFERVAPLEHSVQAYIQDSDSRYWPIASHTIDVEPGADIEVICGGVGGAITGRLEARGGGRVYWDEVEKLELYPGDMTSLDSRGVNTVVSWLLGGRDEKPLLATRTGGFYRTHLSELQPDGGFRMDGVLPGDYQFYLNVPGRGAVTANIHVPEFRSSADPEPVDIGVVVVR